MLMRDKNLFQQGHADIPAAHIPGRDGVWRVTIADGVITEIVPQPDMAAQWVALPPLFDCHVHANRAFSLAGAHPGSFDDAVEMTRRLFATLTAEDCQGYADQLFRRAFAKGTTRLRTHADVAPEIGFEAILGTCAAAHAHRHRMVIEVVAFGTLDPTVSEERQLLERAVALGATHLGGVPLLCPAPGRAIDVLLDMAKESGMPLDVHLDEHLDAANSWSGYLADAVIARGLEGKVTLGHGCALQSLDDAAAAAVMDRMAAAGLTVIALPSTNLYLQDRGGGTPRRRGITLVQEMMARGIDVRFASDNIQDAFYPYGSGDMLEIARLAVTAAHLTDAASVVAGITGGRRHIAVGDEASLLLVEGHSFDQILADCPANRIVVQQGRPYFLPESGAKSGRPS